MLFIADYITLTTAVEPNSNATQRDTSFYQNRLFSRNGFIFVCYKHQRLVIPGLADNIRNFAWVTQNPVYSVHDSAKTHFFCKSEKHYAKCKYEISSCLRGQKVSSCRVHEWPINFSLPSFKWSDYKCITMNNIVLQNKEIT